LKGPADRREEKKETFFYAVLSNALIPENEIPYRGEKMSEPKTIKAGFKTPPLVALLGRGPPECEKRDRFFDLSW
jgi:hypothetical protein